MTREEILQQISTSLADAVQFYQQHEVGFGVLRELANQDLATPGVAFFLASLPNTPSRVLEQLMQVDDPQVLRLLANNPALHPKLAVHPNAHVRRQVAAHRRLSPVVAQQLVHDPAAEVRAELAMNPNIPMNIQRMLLERDPVQFVRLALLKNRRLESEFLNALSDDCDSTVHACALLEPKLPPPCVKSWAEYDEELGQLALSRRTDLLPAVVEMLANSKYPSVRQSLLRHQPKLPEELLGEYVASEDSETLRIIVKRNSLSPATQRALVANPALPQQERLNLAKRADLADEVGVALCENGSPEVRQSLAQNLAEGLLRTRLQLAASGDSYLLKLLLANPLARTPEILSTLVLHATDDVLCHLVHRGVSGADLDAAARERLLQCALPSVRKLAEEVA